LATQSPSTLLSYAKHLARYIRTPTMLACLGSLLHD